MVARNDAPLGTAFTVSVDVRHGLTTGISAEERTNTVRALANGNMGAGDFVRPGHVFPLVAKEGGVLMRSGHTEACVDLCRLAGLPPVGVLAELMNDDGTVMRGPQIAAFAERHKLARVTIADLIAYRQARERLVERVGEFPVESEIGTLCGYAYLTHFDPFYHVAFVYGDISDGRAVPTRLHRANLILDVFGGAKAVRKTLERFKAEGRGVLVMLRDGAAGVPVVHIPKSDETASGEARSRQWREVGLGAQILKDLGVSSIRLLSFSRQMTYVGLSGFGIEIVSTEPVDV
jgi:3,4-dihydroxy 2-butanone 4-phosphate synthase/GTP cyclohydrolase II